MAELRPYDPNKPFITFNLPTREEIIAATLGLIPGYRALKNFHDNPEGPVTESLDLLAEDVVPLYGSFIKPAINGEDIDWNTAGKEAAMNAFALPVFLKNSKKGYIVKPQNTAELTKFNKAVDAAVAKGEISAADGAKFKANAATTLAEDRAYNQAMEVGRLSDNPRHAAPEELIDRSNIRSSELPLYDAAIDAGNNIVNDLRVRNDFNTMNGNKLYLKGDQGNLLLNEHYADANAIRHAASNYDQLLTRESNNLARRFPGDRPGYTQPITINGRRTHVFDIVSKPNILEHLPNGKLGYNYKQNINKPINAGREAIRRDPKYMTVDDFYRIMLGLEE